jgi:hypothetical protein
MVTAIAAIAVITVVIAATVMDTTIAMVKDTDMGITIVMVKDASMGMDMAIGSTAAGVGEETVIATLSDARRSCFASDPAVAFGPNLRLEFDG